MQVILRATFVIGLCLILKITPCHAQSIPLDRPHMTAYALSVIVDLTEQGKSVSEILQLMHEARALLCDPEIPGPRELYRRILLELALELRNQANEDLTEAQLTPEERLIILQMAFESPSCLDPMQL